MNKTKKLKANRPAERAVVNAARTFFDDQNIPFTEVDVGVDFGKDAFIEIIDGDEPTGRLIALQFKGGKQTVRTRGGREHRGIPFKSKDARHFRRSNIPVLGVTAAPGPRGVGTVLLWVNLTALCQARFEVQGVDRGGFADVTDSLDVYRLPAFLRSMTLLASYRVESVALDLARYDDEELQLAAVEDCFAIGLRDARPLLLLRYLMLTFVGRPLFASVSALAHVVGHGDIFYHPGNTVGGDVCNVVRPHMQWTLDEVAMLLEVVPEDDEDQMWGRGVFGEHIIALILNDPNSPINVLRVAENPNLFSRVARYRAFVLTLYLADSEAINDLCGRVLRYSQDLAGDDAVKEIVATIRSEGQLDIF